VSTPVTSALAVVQQCRERNRHPHWRGLLPRQATGSAAAGDRVIGTWCHWACGTGRRSLYRNADAGYESRVRHDRAPVGLARAGDGYVVHHSDANVIGLCVSHLQFEESGVQCRNVFPCASGSSRRGEAVIAGSLLRRVFCATCPKRVSLLAAAVDSARNELPLEPPLLPPCRLEVPDAARSGLRSRHCARSSLVCAACCPPR